MGQKSSIERFRREGKRRPVAYCEFPLLVKPAVDQKPGFAGFNEVA